MTHQKMIGIGAAGRLLGVSVGTLRRMEENGTLLRYGISVYYTPTKQRRYREAEVLAALLKNAKLAENENGRLTASDTAT